MGKRASRRNPTTTSARRSDTGAKKSSSADDVTPARPPRTLRLLSWLSTPAGYTAGVVVLVALGMWARLATWSWRFGGNHVELLPSDSHYYVRLARLQLAARRPVTFDPFVGFPTGSENYWPPVHAFLVTLAVALAPDPEAGAAFVGPVVSFLWFVLIAVAAYRAVGPRSALVTVLLIALTTMSVQAGM